MNSLSCDPAKASTTISAANKTSMGLVTLVGERQVTNTDRFSLALLGGVGLASWQQELSADVGWTVREDATIETKSSDVSGSYVSQREQFSNVESRRERWTSRLSYHPAGLVVGLNAQARVTERIEAVARVTHSYLPFTVGPDPQGSFSGTAAIERTGVSETSTTGSTTITELDPAGKELGRSTTSTSASYGTEIFDSLPERVDPAQVTEWYVGLRARVIGWVSVEGGYYQLSWRRAPYLTSPGGTREADHVPLSIQPGEVDATLGGWRLAASVSF